MQQCITVNQEGRKTVANGDIGASTKGLPHTRMDGFGWFVYCVSIFLITDIA